MAEIIGIRFKREGKQYYFDPQGMTVMPGMGVILETSWGVEFGECVRGNSEVPDEELVAPLRPIVRIATPEDYEIVKKNRELEEEAFALCSEKIQEHELDMKLVDVEFSFEGSKILFFFTSEGRVDFRGLVKDLAAIFHTRIELRQIGVRDEAKMIGGLGICGRPFCCSSFLREFQPVSIKMAKTQNLSLNPTKISGTCGRLMCCLKYEQDAYEDLLRNSPKADSFVETPDGVGDIISVNTLRETVRVRLDSAPDSLKTYHNSEIRVIRSGKGKRPEGYQPPTAEELAKLRKVQEEIVEEAKREENILFPTLQKVFSEGPAEEKNPAEQEKGGEKKGRRPKGRGGSRPRRGSNRKEKKEENTPVKLPAKEGEGKKLPERESKRPGKKSSSQIAMEKALPKEKLPPHEDSGKGEKKSRKPYWRRKPSRRDKTSKEGRKE